MDYPKISVGHGLEVPVSSGFPFVPDYNQTLISRKFTFDAGHRVLGHESKCAHIHGHTYHVELWVRERTDTLDTLGRVIDFSVLKKEVGGWIDAFWDHNFLAHPDDPILVSFDNMTLLSHNRGVRAMHILGDKKPYIMKHGNPTAENIARELFEVANGILAAFNIEVVRVDVRETDNCSAAYGKM